MSSSDSDSSSSSSDSESPAKQVMNPSIKESDDVKNIVEDGVNDKKRKVEEDDNANDNEQGEDGGGFKDIELECRECEGAFYFTAEEQVYHHEMGFDNKPVRCADCRAEKKRRIEESYNEGGGNGNRGFSKRKVCYNCGGGDHLSRDCTEARKEGAGGQDRTCYNCGKPGHISSNCKEPKKEGAVRPGGGGDRTCYKCGEKGHISRDCPQQGIGAGGEDGGGGDGDFGQGPNGGGDGGFGRGRGGG
eukprot:CAMPEP_0194180048 /NCGR_PEP_ID=MMETSP0154-20130528/13369_1 /TAXON_ID=1049557 /ORGANISM="Thalassiothrix antarctica, Strain L6-D1" /LENGTH=245 /DNA_ID=CAMNT_0038895599 /DNA_START=46 /DNA_END=779 /DNA_ORIENTATION=+